LEFIIQTKNLDYSFGAFKALNDVSLEVKEGAIYGFVGPNGAGKTTTIRTLLGLYPVKKETVFVLGKDIQTERINILKNVGAMVETPAHYEHLSARDNLEIARTIHRVDKKRVNEVLDIVGLSKYAGKKVSKFSLGMKQRLGIAWALLSKPRLLILDEPTNGLDPYGIKEIRELLGYLNKEYNTTILISSHILSELERFITDVGIINGGSLVFQGSLSNLYDVSINNLIIETDEPARLLEMLNNMQCEAVKERDYSVKLPVKNKNDIIDLTRKMAAAEIPFYGLHNEQKTLEEIFFDLMKK
jgi:lantibiotic transport system ATP-binding protein